MAPTLCKMASICRIVFLVATILFSVVHGLALQTKMTLTSTSKHILFDIPVSNNGGRARIILYKKGIPAAECCVMSPAEVGGFKSEDYLAISPQGKVPSLKCLESGLCLAESDTVCRYLMSHYAYTGPSFQPDNARSNEIARFHDMYLTTIQSCLYRAVPPFGSFGDRKDALKEYSKQLYIISELMDENGPYLCGKEVSLADATVFPSIVFASFMYPKFQEGMVDQPIPRKIEEWYKRMIDTDSAFQRVHEEVSVV
jgi:glutathione S-transferase